MTKKDKLNRLAKAANHLRSAAFALHEIVEDKSNNHFLCEDAGYYLAQIQELITADHGQAGLDVLIRKVEKEIKP